jgi:hypothetical protein
MVPAFAPIVKSVNALADKRPALRAKTQIIRRMNAFFAMNMIPFNTINKYIFDQNNHTNKGIHYYTPSGRCNEKYILTLGTTCVISINGFECAAIEKIEIKRGHIKPIAHDSDLHFDTEGKWEYKKSSGRNPCCGSAMR